MKIPKHIQEIINKQELHVLSTSTKEGTPNIIYLKFLKVYNNEQIIIANNKFFKTEKNLLENPKISFVVLDKKNKKSYQIKGTAEFHKDDQIFEENVRWVKEEKRCRITTAYVGENGIEADTWYALDCKGNFIKAIQ